MCGGKNLPEIRSVQKRLGLGFSCTFFPGPMKTYPEIDPSPVFYSLEIPHQMGCSHLVNKLELWAMFLGCVQETQTIMFGGVGR